MLAGRLRRLERIAGGDVCFDCGRGGGPIEGIVKTKSKGPTRCEACGRRLRVKIEIDRRSGLMKEALCEIE